VIPDIDPAVTTDPFPQPPPFNHLPSTTLPPNPILTLLIHQKVRDLLLQHGKRVRVELPRDEEAARLLSAEAKGEGRRTVGGMVSCMFVGCAVLCVMSSGMGVMFG
jgi:hypothetical protein